MARQLKVGEHVTVDKMVKFRRQSEPYLNGLRRVKPGQVGIIISVGEGRSSIVDFAGIQATISNQRLTRVAAEAAAAAPAPASKGAKKSAVASKRGRKPKAAGPVNAPAAAASEGAVEAEAEAEAAVTPVHAASAAAAASPAASGLLPRKVGRPRKVQALSGSDKTPTVDPSKQLVNVITNNLLLNGGLKDDAVIAMRFSDLPAETQDRIRALIKAKLDMS